MVRPWDGRQITVRFTDEERDLFNNYDLYGHGDDDSYYYEVRDAMLRVEMRGIEGKHHTVEDGALLNLDIPESPMPDLGINTTDPADRGAFTPPEFKDTSTTSLQEAASEYQSFLKDDADKRRFSKRMVQGTMPYEVQMEPVSKPKKGRGTQDFKKWRRH